MRIATNVSAIVSNNALQKSQDRLTKSIARLSSGYKINSSSDDAAGYAISEKMRLQLRGLNQADNNAADGVSVLHTAEGAMEEIQSMLARMKELSVQAANGTNSVDERSAIQSEIDSLNSEIDRISSNTEFNSQTLISGNLSIPESIFSYQPKHARHTLHSPPYIPCRRQPHSFHLLSVIVRTKTPRFPDQTIRKLREKHKYWKHAP